MTNDRTPNHEVLHWYEQNARHYATLIDPQPPAAREDALRRLIAELPDGGTILEIGSGTGRDANFLESLGVQVCRTDATAAFIALQAERGQVVRKLNILTDELPSGVSGVLAMCVLLHVSRDQTDGVLGKVSTALVPSGVFLVSVREDGGTGVTAWSRPAFVERLRQAGLHVIWEDRDYDGDHWLVFLARKSC